MASAYLGHFIKKLTWADMSTRELCKVGHMCSSGAATISTSLTEKIAIIYDKTVMNHPRKPYFFLTP